MPNITIRVQSRQSRLSTQHPTDRFHGHHSLLYSQHHQVMLKLVIGLLTVTWKASQYFHCAEVLMILRSPPALIMDRSQIITWWHGVPGNERKNSSVGYFVLPKSFGPDVKSATRKRPQSSQQPQPTAHHPRNSFAHP